MCMQTCVPSRLHHHLFVPTGVTMEDASFWSVQVMVNPQRHKNSDMRHPHASLLLAEAYMCTMIPSRQAHQLR